MRDVAISVLGPLEVRVAGQPVHLAGPRQRALLAAMALNCGVVVSVDRLVDELWGSASPASARTQVHTLVHRVRRALGPAGGLIETRPPGYLLNVDCACVDATRCARLIERARSAANLGHLAEAAKHYRDALGLWRGRPLEGVSAEFVAREAGRLEEKRLAGFEECFDAELDLGLHAEIVAELFPLVAENPLREGLRSQLMLALYRSDRQAEALDAYRMGHTLLAEETGLEPGPRLRGLVQAILQEEPELSPPAVRPARRPHRHPSSWGGVAMSNDLG